MNIKSQNLPRENEKKKKGQNSKTEKQNLRTQNLRSCCNGAPETDAIKCCKMISTRVYHWKTTRYIMI